MILGTLSVFPRAGALVGARVREAVDAIVVMQLFKLNIRSGCQPTEMEVLIM